jgi:Na+/proline symporter
MVFVFYQFEAAPLNFNPKAVAVVKNSDQALAFSRLESENLNTQNELKKALLSSASKQEIFNLSQQELDQREQARTLINQVAPEQETNDKDYVFISFILGYLPSGLIGLLIAVIFSAAMSSTASELNALAATTTVDLYQRNVSEKSAVHFVKASKGFTLAWGLVAILFASVGNLFENLIQLVNIIGSVFYGTILGIFLVAIFIKYIKGKAIFWAAVLSELLILILFFLDVISFLWLNVIGALLTLGFGLLFQSFFNEK